MAENAPLRRMRFALPSGVTRTVPSFEATAIQSPFGDHSGTHNRTETSSFHSISPGSLPPTRAFITPEGGPCEVNAIQFPSGDQVGAHCAPPESDNATGIPPVEGAIQISVESPFLGLERSWRTNAIRSPSGEYAGVVRNSLSPRG